MHSEHLKIGRNDSLFPEIRAQVPGKNEQKRENADSCVEEHQAEGSKRCKSRNIVGQISALSQSGREIDVVVQGISSRMSETRQDLLQADPGLLIDRVRKPVVLFLRENRFPATHGGRPQKVIKILLPRRAAGAVHHMKEPVQIKIVPGDVIDLKALPVVQVVLRDLGIALRGRLLGGWLSETAAQ